MSSPLSSLSLSLSLSLSFVKNGPEVPGEARSLARGKIKNKEERFQQVTPLPAAPNINTIGGSKINRGGCFFISTAKIAKGRERSSFFWRLFASFRG
jgi:hypothetical protein